MKRLIILLALPILACSGLAGPASPVVSPFPSVIIPIGRQTQSEQTQAVASNPAIVQTQSPGTTSIPAATKNQPQATRKSTSVPLTKAPPATSNIFPNSNLYTWQLIASGLTRPVDIKPANDGSGRLFIIEKYGAIRIFKNGQLLDTPFLNIDDRVDDSGNEMGLLGMAFHPDYENNGYFYVNYTGDGGNTRISRFHASGDVADPSSEKVLLTINQPFENHNGGSVVFGPEGNLYLGLGDGGSQGDPYKNAQNTSVLLGKILRIDVNHGDPYSIPSDNPFGNEVWAFGLRNPWRISFDKTNGDLWIGDVGQNTWEEIDYFPAGSPNGANYGWSIMEGNHGYDGDQQPGLLLPVAEYNHNVGGCSITGGYVYRGSMSEWNGIYLYGDYCTGFIWGLVRSNGIWQNQRLFQTGATITSFGQDESGELYLASDNGNIYKLTKK